MKTLENVLAILTRCKEKHDCRLCPYNVDIILTVETKTWLTGKIKTHEIKENCCKLIHRAHVTALQGYTDEEGFDTVEGEARHIGLPRLNPGGIAYES